MIVVILDRVGYIHQRRPGCSAYGTQPCQGLDDMMVGGGVHHERRVRPALWVIVGALALPIGLMVAFSAVAAAVKVGDARSAPACTADFSSGCTTQRAAALASRGALSDSWLTGEQRWFADVPDGAPGLSSGERLKLEVPRQQGSAQLVEGAAVTVIYYSRAPAWVRLPSGAVLQTGDHPRRYAPTVGWMALFVIGAGLYAVRVGVTARRGDRVWLRRATADTRPGITGTVTAAGMFGYLGQLVGSGALWPGMVGGLCGVAVAVVASRR